MDPYREAEEARRVPLDFLTELNGLLHNVGSLSIIDGFSQWPTLYKLRDQLAEIINSKAIP